MQLRTGLLHRMFSYATKWGGRTTALFRRITARRPTYIQVYAQELDMRAFYFIGMVLVEYLLLIYMIDLLLHTALYTVPENTWQSS